MSRLKGYEFRPQQVRAALAVQKFLRNPAQSAFALEAPTGVGKTFAVLAPALREAAGRGAHILFLTAGIALQEQLMEKDLPRLRQLLGFPFRFGLLKGRANYVCLRRARAAGNSLFDGEGRSLSQWLEETETGDLAELRWGGGPSLSDLSAGVHNCLGTGCPLREDCFVINAYRKAQDWDLTVANYNLFFSHILGGSGAFPVRYDWLICDEAHRLPDVASSSAAVRASAEEGLALLGTRTLKGFAAFLQRHMVEAPEMRAQADQAREEMTTLFDELPLLLPSSGELQAPNEELLHRGQSIAEAMNALLRPLRPFEDRFMAGEFTDTAALEQGAELMRWIDELRDFRRSLLWCLSVEQFPQWAYWAEAGGLTSRPVLSSGIVQEAIQKEEPEKLILTSATMTLPGAKSGFDFWSQESGIAPDETLVVDSPFDFQNQMEVLVVDVGLKVMETGYDERMCRIMERLCDRNGGRSLVLLSSLRLMRAFARRMREPRPYEVLVQGDMPQRQLLKRFTEDETSVLIGSVSFREGVDVPGEGLTQVIIDRIPFPHPADPMVRARNALEGNKAFFRVTLPRARLFLRQAAGRLIRSASDHGRVVLLDGRAVDRREWNILSSFPPCKRKKLIVRDP